MPKLAWPKSPETVLKEYENRHGSNSLLFPLVTWAVFAVENLYYLDDLDQVQAAYPNPVQGHHADIVDIAHVRWATGTAITSLDLCAATLGRVCCGWTGSREMDLRDFDPSINPKKAKTVRKPLPSSALTWVDGVLDDEKYKQIHDARNPFMHSWLTRHLTRHQFEFVGGATIGGVDSHVERIKFTVRETGKTLGARELVTLAKDLATQYVREFLYDVVDKL